eukprot:COSAG04_NODE_134_length_23866_cov_4.802036_6_plen_115_part_00
MAAVGDLHVVLHRDVRADLLARGDADVLQVEHLAPVDVPRALVPELRGGDRDHLDGCAGGLEEAQQQRRREQVQPQELAIRLAVGAASLLVPRLCGGTPLLAAAGNKESFGRRS